MHRKSRFTLVMMSILLMFGMVGIQPVEPVQAALASDLFFSEYIEGTYSNRAIEIYNGTGAPVDLSDYRLEIYSNGASSPSASVVLSGMLLAGDVFVAAHGSAAQDILDQADLTNSAVINFDGNDAFALYKISTGLYVDVIGHIGYPPPTVYWGTTQVRTQDRTLIRKASICAGDTNGSDDFDPVTEWDMYPTDRFDFLGAHTSNCVLNEAEALAWLQENTTISGTLDAFQAEFPAVIPDVVVDAGYYINSRITLAEELPEGSLVTIERDGGVVYGPAALTGAGPWWYTQLLGAPLTASAPFDHGYDGQLEGYSVTITGNHDVINTTLTVESVISKDLTDFDPLVVLASHTMDVIFAETIAPVMQAVTPAKGIVTLAADETFVLIVDALDLNLYELEIDHSFQGTLPEFSVYASEATPWGTQADKDLFDAAGVSISYDADLQQWTIDFGEDITDMFIPGGVTFYMVLIDEAGNTWGSMSPPTGENTYAYTFDVTNTLEQEITSAVTYEYDPVYEYVGEIGFDESNNIFTATYSPAEFLAEGAMNDLARYLGALYRQDISTIIEISYGSETYTWDPTEPNTGSNWYNGLTSLVSVMVADYLAAPGELVITVSDGWQTSDVTFRLLITNTLDDEIESAPSYVYTDYTYVGDYAFVDATNIYTVTYDDVEFNPNAMNDLARYLGALYYQDNSTVISIVYDGVTYTWDETGTLKGSNWEDASGNTLVRKIVDDFEAGLINPAVGLELTVSDDVHTEDVTFKFVILDTIAPEISSGVAKSAADGNVDLVDGAFTVDQGYVVDTIDITMTEDVLVDLGTVVTMVGYGPYGTVTAHDGALITITPTAGYETAALIGTFTFTVPDGSITDLAGNAFTGSIVLNVLEVVGTISWEGTGGVTPTIVGDTVTFDGEIAYYTTVDGPPTNGHWVGVQIDAPAGYDTVDTTFTINGGTPYTWDAVVDGDNFVWIYKLVSTIPQTTTIVVNWNAVSVQTFTIEVAETSTFELENSLAYLQANTELSSVSGMVDDLTATFPDEIPAAIVAEDYVIDSRISLSEALPEGVTVTVYKDGVAVLTDITLSGVGPFWFTELFTPDPDPRADFDANYGTKVEEYSIILNGAVAFDYSSTVTVESVISKDDFTTETVLDDIDLAASIAATEAEALNYVIENTILSSDSGTIDDLKATFPESIPPLISDGNYVIDSRITLADPLPAGTTVTVYKNDVPVLSEITLDGTGPFLFTTLFDPDETQENFDDLIYGGTVEDYVIELTGPGDNPLDFDTTVMIESVLFKFGLATGIVLDEITLDAHIDDAVAPVMEEVLPAEGALLFGPEDTLVLTVDAADLNLYELEIDHSLWASLPEFSVYADALTPWGTEADKAQFDAAGVTVAYDDVEQVWTIDFGDVITDKFITNGGITFYMVLKDLAGNTWGSMSPTTDANTYIYTIELDAVAPVMEAVTPAEGALFFGSEDTFVLTVDAADDNLYELEIDHSLSASLPEFSVYADALNPWGTPEDKAQFDAAGVTVAYDDLEQVWTIDFGDTVTDAFIANGGITFYMVLTDMVGNQWGTMYGTTPDNTYVYTITLDDVTPIMEEVLPAEGALLFGPDDTFVLTVDAADLNLYELEIDHSLWASLPEFSVYADALTPWGTEADKAQFDAAGVTVAYDDLEQVWTIDFGPNVTNAFINNGGITFYMVLKDLAGNTWGSMDPTMDANTYIYTIELDAVAPVMESVAPGEGLVTLGLDDTFVLIVDALDLNLYELEIDHSFEGTLPEFSVYASEATPWGTQADKDLFDAAGVTIDYDADLQQWTIDFGEGITDNYFIPGGVTFYMVLIDEAGNTWGSMDPTTGENTFAYTFEVTNTLEPEITSAVTYEYVPVYEYVGVIDFDDPNNIFTATYSPAEFLAEGAMNDLARYLGALYRQDTSTIIKITFNGVEYTWDETGTLKGSNWEDASGGTLVEAMVPYYFSASYDPEVGMPITVHDGWHTSGVTFKLLITNTLDDEIESAPSYVYTDYTYVGTRVFDDATNIYTVTYNDVDFNPNAMYDLARYLGALYRQDNATVISIVYGEETYTWDAEGGLQGSNWVDSLGNTLVSKIVDDFDAGLINPVVGLALTVSDGVHVENVTFKFVILDTIAPVVTITGVEDSISGEDLPFSTTDGYVFEIDNISSVDRTLQFTDGTVSNETLKDEYFGLYLVESTVSAADLKAYYATRGTPDPYLTYLNDAADGLNPFVYIKEEALSLSLVDAAQHDISPFEDVDMTIPDDFPVGTYTVQGVVEDAAGNQTTVTLTLTIEWSEEAGLAYVLANTVLSSVSGTIADLTATFPASIPPVIVDEDYVINSRMTLSGDTIPAGSTVTIMLTVNGGTPFAYATDAAIPVSPFWVTDLVGGTAADFEASYGGRVEFYSITINSAGGNPLALNGEVLVESVISKDGFTTETVLDDISLDFSIPADEEAALAWLQANTVLSSVSGMVDDLTATFPASIPPVIVAEDYVIDSRMTLVEALPAGSTVTVYKDGVAVLTDITLSGVGPFWFTELFTPDPAPRADFDANYGTKVEEYSIVVTGPGTNPLDFETTVFVESVISKDGFATETVLDDITLGVLIPADEAAALAWLQANTVLSSVSGTIADLKATFPASIPPVIVAEDYVIDSRITLSEALPEGVTVNVYREGNLVLENLVLEGTGPFWFTQLFDPDAQRAAFDAGYGGAIENYSFILNGAVAFDYSSVVTIESVILKGADETVLDDIDLAASIAATEAEALAYVIENTILSSVSGTIADLKATFPDHIPPIISDGLYVIDSRFTLAEALPLGTTVTVFKNGAEILTDITLSGTGPFWFTTLFDPDQPRANFDESIYAGEIEEYEIVLTGPGDNPLDFDTTLKVESVLFKFGLATEIVLDEITLDAHIDDAVAPEMVEVLPIEGLVTLAADESFVMTVKASDPNLYELEIDHSFEGTLPEFSVYASEETPWGTDTDKDMFDAAGVSISYDADLQQWTIDFGEDITDMFIPGGVTFYMVLIDEAGNAWGSMSPPTGENTYAYTFEVTNTLEPEITSAVTYEYTPVYDYVGDVVFDDPNNIFTATYSPAEFLAEGAMNDLARYLGALYRQDGSTVISIVYDGVTYTWDETGILKGSNWEDTIGDTLVSAMVADYLAAPGELVITVSDGWHTSNVTFRLLITNTLDDEIESAPSYVYTDYTYVGDYAFVDATNIYTVTYDDVEFNPNAMNDLARYLGALYRQDSSTVISIVYDGVTYTWDETGTLKGSNWEDASGNTLVSAVIAGIGSYDPAVGLVFTVSDGVHVENVTFKFVILDTIAPDVDITAATVDGEPMDGDLETGYILPTTNDPTIDHLLQIAATVDAPLADEYFGLYFVEGESTVTAAELQAYYAARGTPDPYLTYLNDAADGVNPFVYIREAALSLSLVDAAKHDIAGDDVDMTVPDTFPLGTYVVRGMVADVAGNETEVTLILIVTGDRVEPVVEITAATVDGEPMDGDLETGYILPTTNDPTIDHLLQIAATVDAPLADEYFGLTFVEGESTVTAAELQAYYAARGTPDPYLTYLNDAADGVNPFVYIKEAALSLSLVDAAKHDIQSTDVDMTVPDDFPLGTYVVRGMVADVAGNETEVTLILIVTGDRVEPVVEITTATVDGVAMDGDLETGYILPTTNDPTIDHLLQIAATVDAPLADEYFGLTFVEGESTVTAAELQAYYAARGTPDPYLTYLNDAADGVNPFVYIKEAALSLSLVDAAMHDIQSTDVDMTVPDDFPLGTYVVRGMVADVAGNETEVTLILIVTGDRVEPVVDITAATVDGVAMDGDLETGYILPTTNDPGIDHLLQITATVDAPLADEYFGLYFVEAESTVSAAELQAYYAARGTPDPYLTYLNNAADGVNPFVYIRETGLNLSLVDAAKHDIQSTDVDMTVPDDFPLGTYVVRGMVADVAGNETEVTLILIVTGDRVSPTIESGVAKSASDGDVNLVDGAFTVDQGYVVDTIEITLDEDVLVDLGTIVTMEGYGPYGTITANVDGVITITPYPGYETAALIGTFTFTVPDGSITDLAGNPLETLSVTLVVNNVAPVAVDDAYMTDEDVVLNVPARGVLANDTDFDPSMLTAVTVTGPANGSLMLNADGSFTYTPDADFFGTDTFTYKANDGELDSNVATVTITVTEFKDQVIAVDDEYETDEDTMLTIAAPGVLANDIDVDFNIMTAGLVTNVEHGTLTLNGDGSFTYDPDPDFHGTDSFEYQLVTYPAPQSLWTDEAVVTITVNPIDDAPVLGLIADATIPEEVEFSFTATATDADLPNDVLTFSLVGAPDGAAITESGVFTWTPTEEQGPGTYTFTVMVCDDTHPTPLCDEQEVTLTVTEVNSAPVAQDLIETTLEDTLVDVTLVATDAEDDALTYAIVDQPAHGTVALVGTTATYTPALDFNGEDSFTYKANDGLEDSAMAVVTITVTPVNDAPVAVEDQYETDEDVVLTVTAPGVLENDYDVDGDEMTIIPVGDVSNGTLDWTLNGGFIYTPDENFFGSDSFTYKLSDGTLESDTVTVTLTVNAVNDWVEANDDAYETTAGVTLDIAAPGVLENDVLLDPDETVSLEVIVQPAGGMVTLNDNGSFTYVPNAGFFGVDTFEYQLNSIVLLNGEFSDTAIVTIVVKPYMGVFLPLIMR